MMKKQKGNLLIAFGVILLAGALGLACFNVYEAKNAREASLLACSVIEEQIAEKKPEENPSSQNPAEEEIPDYILHPEMEMPVITVDGIDYIGTVEIPALGIKLPVISEWSYPGLKKAPCRYFGSVYTDNMVIAGHNYSSHFKGLEDVPKGELVIFYDADGNGFLYRVSAKEVLPPTAVEEMTSGWDLTLFTCNAAGTYRVAIRCDREQ